jgi:ABC-type thiamine transport system ATPase subunit
VRVWNANTGGALHTRENCLSIKSTDVFGSSLNGAASSNILATFFRVEDQWIVCQGQKIVWLPPSMRPSMFTDEENVLAPLVHGSRIAIVGIRCGVSVWKLDRSWLQQALHR